MTYVDYFQLSYENSSIPMSLPQGKKPAVGVRFGSFHFSAYAASDFTTSLDRVAATWKTLELKLAP